MAEDFPKDLFKAAHRASTSNRIDLQQGEVCGCFYCLNVFNSSEIEEWTEDRGGDTAICPRCGIDAVISEKAGYPLTKSFLSKMQEFWFD